MWNWNFLDYLRYTDVGKKNEATPEDNVCNILLHTVYQRFCENVPCNFILSLLFSHSTVLYLLVVDLAWQGARDIEAAVGVEGPRVAGVSRETQYPAPR